MPMPICPLIYTGGSIAMTMEMETGAVVPLLPGEDLARDGVCDLGRQSQSPGGAHRFGARTAATMQCCAVASNF